MINCGSDHVGKGIPVHFNKKISCSSIDFAVERFRVLPPSESMPQMKHFSSKHLKDITRPLNCQRRILPEVCLLSLWRSYDEHITDSYAFSFQNRRRISFPIGVALSSIHKHQVSIMTAALTSDGEMLIRFDCKKRFKGPSC